MTDQIEDEEDLGPPCIPGVPERLAIHVYIGGTNDLVIKQVAEKFSIENREEQIVVIAREDVDELIKAIRAAVA